MKKFVFVLSFVFMALISNAQLFLAGGFRAYVEDLTNTPQYGVIVEPSLVYMMPKAVGFGVSLGIGYENFIDESIHDRPIMQQSYNFSPFFRFVFADYGKIKLYSDLKLPFLFANLGPEEMIDIKMFTCGFRLIPGITFSLSDSVSFNTEIGLLSISFLHTTTTYSSFYKHKEVDLLFGANGRTVASFGFVFRL